MRIIYKAPQDGNQDCSWCGRPSEAATTMADFICPVCETEFCATCAPPISEGGGKLVKCPNPECQAGLQL